MLRLFGIERVQSVLSKLQENIFKEDYNEVKEQTDFAIDTEVYFQTHTFPPMEEILRHPKTRYIAFLAKQYSMDELVKMAKERNVPFNAIFQIKKMMGLSI